jgi:hypothetical protein
MEIANYAYIPLIVSLDDVPKFINHIGMSSLSWSRGLSGNWSNTQLAEIRADISSGTLSFVMTMTPRMLNLINSGNDVSESDSKYIAGLVLTMLNLDSSLHHYEKEMSSGYKFVVSKKIRILSKNTDKGVEYVTART